MRATSDPIIHQLDEAARGVAAAERVRETLARVVGRLAAGDAPMAWEPVPLDAFGGGLPAGIRSCWIFVLGAGESTTAERHPNSHQRSMSLTGGGRFEVRGEDAWAPHPLVSDAAAFPDGRWVSIPANAWHRLSVGAEPWGMLSFHTVPAEELVEEKPADPDDLAGATVRHLYSEPERVQPSK